MFEPAGAMFCFFGPSVIAPKTLVVVLPRSTTHMFDFFAYVYWQRRILCSEKSLHRYEEAVLKGGKDQAVGALINVAFCRGRQRAARSHCGLGLNLSRPVQYAYEAHQRKKNGGDLMFGRVWVIVPRVGVSGVQTQDQNSENTIMVRWQARAPPTRCS